MSFPCLRPSSGLHHTQNKIQIPQWSPVWHTLPLFHLPTLFTMPPTCQALPLLWFHFCPHALLRSVQVPAQCHLITEAFSDHLISDRTQISLHLLALPYFSELYWFISDLLLLPVCILIFCLFHSESKVQEDRNIAFFTGVFSVHRSV